MIRFPEEVVRELNAYFDNPDNDAPEIELDLDRERFQAVSPRVALKVGVNGEEYKASVMELPTISSTFKTIDRINYFKSNDITEMIVVHDQEDDWENIYQDMAEKVQDREGSNKPNNIEKVVKYKCESGITQPAKYIRQMNFKEKPDIERGKVAEVDKEMESIRYENSQTKQKDKQEKKSKQPKSSK